MILICLDIYRDDERLYPPRSVRISNNKVSFGLKNKKLSKKLLALGADHTFLQKTCNLIDYLKEKKYLF